MQNPVFAGRACYCDLGGGNRAKLQFVTQGHADHYSALRATILNRSDGNVDALLFRFSDIWGEKRVTSGTINPHIWHDGDKADWYIYHPTADDFKKLADSVSAYMNVFTDRQHTREKESVVDKLCENNMKNTASKISGNKRFEPEL